MSDLIYLASPYSKYPYGKLAAFVKVTRKAAQLMQEGKRVFCPIAHSHPIEDIALVAGDWKEGKDGDWWLEQDFAVLEHCDVLLVYKMQGWEESYGVQKEIEFAKKNNIKIEYLEDDNITA